MQAKWVLEQNGSFPSIQLVTSTGVILLSEFWDVEEQKAVIYSNSFFILAFSFVNYFFNLFIHLCSFFYISKTIVFNKPNSHIPSPLRLANFTNQNKKSQLLRS
ncbi:hypothetical protein A5881_001304 [Enterococcus termitis]|nr:hypothetical protein A5881_002969 [Enterococcus termitis]